MSKLMSATSSLRQHQGPAIGAFRGFPCEGDCKAKHTCEYRANGSAYSVPTALGIPTVSGQVGLTSPPDPRAGTWPKQALQSPGTFFGQSYQERFLGSRAQQGLFWPEATTGDHHKERLRTILGIQLGGGRRESPRALSTTWHPGVGLLVT